MPDGVGTILLTPSESAKSAIFFVAVNARLTNGPQNDKTGRESTRPALVRRKRMTKNRRLLLVLIVVIGRLRVKIIIRLR